jgi:aspartate/methionine/tyrosine aminotransferase
MKTMSRLSRRITNTSAKSYGMCDEAAAYSTQSGLIHLELGRPYCDTPQHIEDATVKAGEGHLRLCFGSQPYEVIEEAMDRLSRFFAALPVARVEGPNSSCCVLRNKIRSLRTAN